MRYLFSKSSPSRVVATIATTLFLILSCMTLSFCKQKQNTGFRETELIVHYPITILNGDSIRHNVFIDSVKVLEYKELVLYTLPSKRILENNAHIQGTNSYFIYKKNSTKGVWLKTLDSLTNYTTHMVDSFLENRAFKNTKLVIPPNDTLIGKERTAEGYVEKWTPRKLISESQYDTLYYYFSKNIDSVNLKLSPVLDSISKHHLYKVRIAFNERFSSSYMRMLPKKEYYFETKHGYVKETDERISKLLFVIGSNILK